MTLPAAGIFAPFRGKPFRRIQREVYQRWYRYPRRNLLIIGQPKSGSTWLFNMVCEVPGYLPWTPNYIKFERHDLQPQWADRVAAGYTVTKTHTRPTEANLSIIKRANRPYVTLLRDLRDIAVSWSFYVGNETHHPRHDLIKPLSLPQRLDYFIEQMLPEFVFWSIGWHDRLHPQLGMLVRYEQLLANPTGIMAEVLAHFGITLQETRLNRIVAAHEFQRRTGRVPGQEDSTQFNRKGIAGDWVNHFSEHHKEAFKRIAGPALVTLGYEQDQTW